MVNRRKRKTKKQQIKDAAEVSNLIDCFSTIQIEVREPKTIAKNKAITKIK